MQGPKREQAAFKGSCQFVPNGQVHNAAAAKRSTIAMIPIM